jgi:general secretion pathway protein L
VGAVALGLALEGLKKPRSPAINFLKGEFLKQNHRLQIFWRQWGELGQFAAIVFVLFLVFSFAREQIASNLSDSSEEALKAQATSVGHLNSKQANAVGVEKFISLQHKQSQDVRAVKGLAKMNSALDWLAKVSDAVPTKSQLQLRVTHFAVHDNRLDLEGTLGRASDLPLLQQALGSLAVGGKVESRQGSPSASGESAFALSLTIDRGITTGQKIE